MMFFCTYVFLVCAVGVLNGYRIDEASDPTSWKQPRQFPYYPLPPSYNGFSNYYQPPSLQYPVYNRELGMSPLYRDLVLNYITSYAGKGPVQLYEYPVGMMGYESEENDNFGEMEVPVTGDVDLNVVSNQMKPSDFTLFNVKSRVDFDKIKTKSMERYPTTLPVLGGVVSDYVLNVEKEGNSVQEKTKLEAPEIYTTLRVINPREQQTEESKIESVFRRRRDLGDYFLTAINGREVKLGDIEDDDVIIPADPSRKDKDDKQEQAGETAEEQQPAIAQSKPSAIALAGPGGVAQASPIGTALVGPGGIAVASPSGTAVAGPGTQGAVQVSSSEEKLKLPITSEKDGSKKQKTSIN